ncbi:hypothetical protein M409DRAFT_62457 [Zasmidium cellare ATCC 36951]|uniref:Major facilitator superfamily (MFS) profile domain-containing protein n=1 Tax=Zasmidium cellare ATCC 36951 TaxID=1080233 RepID=A0A6A6CZS1_ZASCE|nr:uncharacterized protein M409DRAFT_62457 [Zasmidium cellare ATCC 36951]KAF2172747.1 hypothetical protein M409DRAFT_62457 [Zasmidium cellare ATCC 36951]
MILMLVAYLDRSNIGNAKVFGLVEGLHLHGNQFNNISTVFYATYVVFEVPWVIAVKRFGANRVLAVALVCWSVVTLCTGFIHNYAQALAMRLLLGAAEAGLFPSLAFCAKRICLLYMSAALSGAFGGMIAYGVETMGNQLGLAAWRWLFIIEGAVSVALCSAAWFTLPRSSEQAWFLTPEEKAIMQARRARNVAYQGSTDSFKSHHIVQAFTDPQVYLAAILQFGNTVSQFGFSTFLPTLLTGFGYTSLQANYVSIPCYVVAAISLFTWASISDRLGKRALISFVCCLPRVLGYAIVAGTANKAAGYFAMYMCAAGIYPYNEVLTTWVSNNITPDYKRSAALPLFVCLANISGIVASQIYPASDAPRYITDNATSLAPESLSCVGVGLLWLLLKRRNQRKSMEQTSEGGLHEYLDDDRGPNFEYAL